MVTVAENWVVKAGNDIKQKLIAVWESQTSSLAITKTHLMMNIHIQFVL